MTGRGTDVRRGMPRRWRPAGSTAHTRDPSGSRASTTGEERSRRRPSGARIRSTTTARSAAAMVPAGSEQLTVCARPRCRRPALTSTSSTVVVGEQGVERAEAVEAGDRGSDQLLAGCRGARRVGRRDGGERGPRHRPHHRAALGGAAQLRRRDARRVSTAGLHAAPRELAHEAAWHPRGQQSGIDRAGDGRIDADRRRRPVPRRLCSTSAGRRLRPGSATSTTPSGRHPAARSARITRQVARRG